MAEITSERRLDPVDVLAYINAVDSEGKPSNVSPAVLALLKGGETITVDGRVTGVHGKSIHADIEIANVKVNEKPYNAEFVALRAVDIDGAMALMDGVLDYTEKTNDKGETRETPSVVKYFNQGFSILARNATAARIKTNVEGPDVALLASAKKLAQAKGWVGEEGIQKALAKVKAIMAED